MPPNLDTVPSEIVQLICRDARFRGFDVRHGKRIHLSAVRLVSKSLYGKTLHLFAKDTKLDDICFALKPSELSMLLRLSSIPLLRAQMNVITLRGRHWSCFYEGAFASRRWETSVRKRVGKEEYENSPEAYCLLRAIFSQLELATSVHTINIRFLAPSALKALSNSELDKRVFVLAFNPREVTE